MDLDDELRRMFHNSGDQLDIPVRGDAEQTIVAGAGRRRKRRLAAVGASGAAAMAVVVAAGIALANPTPEAMPPAIPTSTTEAPSETTSTTTPTSETVPVPPPATVPPGDDNPPQGTTEEEEPPPPATQGEEIGPNGFRDLRLGMDFESALATGMIGEGEPPGEFCQQYPLLIDGAQAGWVNITAARGIETIGPNRPVHTPEGLSVGWTTEQFLAEYPDEREGVEQYSRANVPVPGNGNAVYRLDGFENGQIASITLQFGDQSCYE